MSLLRIFLATGLLAGAAWAQPRLINGVAVVVNDAVITVQDVRLYVAQTWDLLARQYGNQPVVLEQRRHEVWDDGLKQLVERQLILHEFATSPNASFPESIIDDNIRDRIKQRFGDRATLARTLKAEGQTMENFRRRVREEIIIEAMRYQHVSKDLIISPQKILRYYDDNKTNYMIADQVKLRMIVLNKPAGGDGGTTVQLAREILGKIKDGATFEEMARIHSEGSQRADGGSWGWVERKVLRKELGDVAFVLAKGAISDVIDLPEACFIMFVEDTRPAHVKPMPEVRDEIEKNLLLKERARLQDQWISRLRAKTFVQTYSY